MRICGLIALVHGFVVAVADVDSLFIVDETTVRIVILEVAEVHGRGRAFNRISIGVRKAPGWVDLTRQCLRQRYGTEGSGGANPHCALDLRVVVEEAQLHLVARVDNYNHIVEVGRDAVEEGNLIVR